MGIHLRYANALAWRWIWGSPGAARTQSMREHGPDHRRVFAISCKSGSNVVAGSPLIPGQAVSVLDQGVFRCSAHLQMARGAAGFALMRRGGSPVQSDIVGCTAAPRLRSQRRDDGSQRRHRFDRPLQPYVTLYRGAGHQRPPTYPRQGHRFTSDRPEGSQCLVQAPWS